MHLNFIMAFSGPRTTRDQTAIVPHHGKEVGGTLVAIIPT